MNPMQYVDPDAHERWLHELRNVVNVLGSGLVLSRRLIEKGRPDEAHGVLVDTERSLQQCFAMLAGGDASLDAPRHGDARAPDLHLNN